MTHLTHDSTDLQMLYQAPLYSWMLQPEVSLFPPLRVGQHSLRMGASGFDWGPFGANPFLNTPGRGLSGRPELNSLVLSSSGRDLDCGMSVSLRLSLPLMPVLWRTPASNSWSLPGGRRCIERPSWVSTKGPPLLPKMSMSPFIYGVALIQRQDIPSPLQNLDLLVRSIKLCTWHERHLNAW